MIDNHIFQGNALNIDPRKITWKRCVDMNDRQLRFVVDGLGGKTNGMPREDGYDITVASEIMAVLCLANDINDLKKRLGHHHWIYIRKSGRAEAGYRNDLHAEGAMTALLKDALKPNLVQTLKVYRRSYTADHSQTSHMDVTPLSQPKMALEVIMRSQRQASVPTRAEKFLDIKCRMAA